MPMIRGVGWGIRPEILKKEKGEGDGMKLSEMLKEPMTTEQLRMCTQDLAERVEELLKIVLLQEKQIKFFTNSYTDFMKGLSSLKGEA